MLGSQIPTATAALRFPFLAADISLDIPIFRALTKHKSSNTLPFFWRRGQRARTGRRGSLWGRHVSRSYCGVSQHHSCSQKPGISAHRSQTTPKNPRSMYHSNPEHGQWRCWKHCTILESENSAEYSVCRGWPSVNEKGILCPNLLLHTELQFEACSDLSCIRCNRGWFTPASNQNVDHQHEDGSKFASTQHVGGEETGN